MHYAPSLLQRLRIALLESSQRGLPSDTRSGAGYSSRGNIWLEKQPLRVYVHLSTLAWWGVVVESPLLKRG